MASGRWSAVCDVFEAFQTRGHQRMNPIIWRITFEVLRGPPWLCGVLRGPPLCPLQVKISAALRGPVEASSVLRRPSPTLLHVEAFQSLRHSEMNSNTSRMRYERSPWSSVAQWGPPWASVPWRRLELEVSLWSSSVLWRPPWSYVTTNSLHSEASGPSA